MTTNSSIKLAFHIPTRKVIHIDIAENGKGCNCECLKCKEKLIAVQGDFREKHFRHDLNRNCNGSQETALHLLGKQIIVDHNQIEIPRYGTINYSEPVLEKDFGSTRPDVTAIYNTQKIYFEIAVTHFIEKGKENFFKSGQHKCVEISLRDIDTQSYEKIKHFVLSETSNKKLFGWEPPQDYKKSEDNWLDKIAIGAFLFLVANWIFRRRRR